MPMPFDAAEAGRIGTIPAALLLHRDGGLFERQPAHLLAGAALHVDPLVDALVDLRLPGAGVRAGQVRAIVLAGLRDAVALFLRRRVGGRGGRCQAHREDRGEGGGNDETLIHGCSKKVVPTRPTSDQATGRKFNTTPSSMA